MRIKVLRVLAGMGILALPVGALGADHVDSPAATNEPGADITDVYAWMSTDTARVNVVLNVFPFATSAARFSDAVQYAVHVNSSASYGAAQTETLVICEFAADQTLSCWVGSDEHVSGDASAQAGITSGSGRVRVFAGPRNDPFFFELNGFKQAVSTVVGAASGLTFDAAGCPAVDGPTSAALVGQLQHGTAGAAVSDTFLGENVLSIVLEIDKTLLTTGGPLLGVWASTHRKS